MGVRATQLTVAHAARPAARRTSASSRTFVGGGFGIKAMVWPHVTLTAMAARARRPAGEADARPARRCSPPTGTARSRSSAITLGADAGRPADRDPAREALAHLAVRRLGRAGDRRLARSSTRCENYRGVHRLIQRQHDDADVHPRPGRVARRRSRSRRAMDELAYAARHRPGRAAAAQPRRRSIRAATRGPATGCAECLRLGAERFGWAERDPAPAHDARRRLADRHRAWPAAAYPIAFFMPAQRARARIHADGSAVVQTAHAGVRHRRARPWRRRSAPTRSASPSATCEFQAGDTDLPNSTAAVGSAGAGMVSSAVHAAGTALREQLIAHGGRRRASRRCTASSPTSVTVADGRMTSSRAAGRGRHLRRAARPQPPGRRRGDRHVAPAAARHAARAAHLRRAVRRGRRRPRARAGPRPPAASAPSRPGACSTRCSPAAS